jgi:hypothetical protein
MASPSRRGSAAAALAIAAAILSFPAMAEKRGDPLSLDTSCSEPAATPICAHLTWTRCLYEEEPSLCRLVGVDDVTFEGLAALPPDSYYTDEYFDAHPFEEWIVGVRKVGRDRFAEFLDDEGLRISEDMIGTHEVTEKPDVCYGQPCAVKASTFWRKKGNRWVLASWTSNDLSCEGWEPPDPVCQRSRS